VAGDVVNTTLGSGPDALPVHARIANRHGDEIGLQLLITDDRQGKRIDEYLSAMLS
jgi:hypothetical protein